MLKKWTSELLTRKLPALLASVVRIQGVAVQTELQGRLESFRAHQNNPFNHTEDHIGQFYKLSPEAKKKIFLYGGFPKSYEIQLKTFAESCLMIRQPSIDIINCLNVMDYSKPIVRFVIYGKKGNGKTLTLAHVLHYAFEAGFLLVHVPWVGNWMRRCKESSNSQIKEGHIDLNLDAAAWLIHFKNQNMHLLENPDLVTSQDHVWSKREKTLKGAPLLELLDHGINRVKYASQCVIVLAEEIKKLSTAGKCRTLVAVDGFNAFFYPTTRVLTERKKPVHPSQVTLTEAFLNLTRFDWTNGAVVVTLDELAIAEKDQISHLPLYLLGKTGFEHMDPFIPILVPTYTAKELKSCLDYYRERRWIRPLPGLDEELAFLSASNPYKLMQLCNSV